MAIIYTFFVGFFLIISIFKINRLQKVILNYKDMIVLKDQLISGKDKQIFNLKLLNNIQDIQKVIKHK